jgi:hypothetical protein
MSVPSVNEEHPVLLRGRLFRQVQKFAEGMGGQSNIACGITCAAPRVSSFKYIPRKVRTVRNTVRGTRAGSF